jgi:asparagine synthase (glutamine-hydrolysing)
MCGIAGIIAKPNQAVPNMQDQLTCMAAAMQHRGPDDQGIYLSPGNQVGLANRRLAIRDLSPAGHMPMGNATESVWITYNGEIYNAADLRTQLETLGYVFRSHSDTEVILHGYEAWGTALIPKLRGMFAFAIYDQRDSQEITLLLARDHMGIKPLYYAQTPTAFVFASELKAVVASRLVSREIDPAGLVGYLLLGSVPNPLTIYQGIQELPPATYLRFCLDSPHRIDLVTYWLLPEAGEVEIQPNVAIEQVRHLLEEAVRIRLVSDVPLGAFLSGGLDSSAVVALMRQATNGQIRTCSMVFEEAAFSEASYARTMAGAVNAEHHERVITANDLHVEFDNILAAMDQPSVDGVNTYFVSQTACQAGLTVALSGLGGDELFGGYPNTFGQVPQLLNMLRLIGSIPGGRTLARTALGRLPVKQRWRWMRLRDALNLLPSPSSAYLSRRGLFAPSEVQALVTPDIWHAAQQRFVAVDYVAQQAGNHRSATMDWISRAELRTYTHNQLLRDTDVMSMAHSLEVREPLLDVDLVECVLQLPAALKMQSPTGDQSIKPLLLMALGDRLPPAIRMRQDKQGFSFPFDLWLRGPLAHTLSQHLPQNNWLHQPMVQQLVTSFADGHSHWSRLWGVMVLGTLA